MISISGKSRYAVAALVELAHHGDGSPMPVSELARRRVIPGQFLEQLFAVLRRAGLVTSQRGVKGGYRLARPATDISVLEIVEALDGPVGGGEAMQAPWDDLTTSLRDQLAALSLEDVHQRELAATGGPMYY